MGIGALLLVAFAGWIVWTGRLARLTALDGAMLGCALIGAVMAAKGRPLVGGAALALALFYAATTARRSAAGRRESEPQEVIEARALLGLEPGCSEQEIRDAHRRIIARVHPDVGGTPALAEKANAARNILLRHHLESKRSHNTTHS